MQKLQKLNQLLNSIKNQDNLKNGSIYLVNNNLMRNSAKKSAPSSSTKINILSETTKKIPTSTQTIKTINFSPKKHKIVSPLKKSRIIQEISSQNKQLLKQMFLVKCQKLRIEFNEDKFESFLINYTQKNSAQQEKNGELNLGCLNLVHCQSAINKFINNDPSKISKLNLQKTPITPHILFLNNISSLHLGNCDLHNQQLQKLFSLLIKLNRIKILSLSSPQINYKNHLTKYQKLYQLILECTTLQQLYLSSCSIRKDNLIFGYLKNSNIKVVDLSYNYQVVGISSVLERLNLQGNSIQNPDLLYINQCKSRNQLKYLNISKNPIPHYDLAKFIKSSYLSKVVQLKMNNIKIYEECQCIQQLLTYSYSLKRLCMADCQLQQQSWQNVIQGLLNNDKVLEVNLSKNAIPNEQIAKNLGQIFIHSQIQKINLNQCQIKDQYGALIFRNLQNNRSLQHIEAAQNKLNSKSGMTLANILKSNYKIKYLNIESNCVSYLIQKQLKQYINRNKYLQAENTRKQFDSLSGIQNLQIFKKKQLQNVQFQLNNSKKQTFKIQQTVYQIKSSQKIKQINQIKKSIKDLQEQENNIIQKIEDIQNQFQYLDTTPMSNSYDSRMKGSEKVHAQPQN